MIERIKSIILIFLVGLSLLLTYQLWYGQKPAQLIAEDIYERVSVEKPRSLELVVTPSNIVITVAGALYQFREGEPFFQKSWDTVSQILQETNKDNIEEIGEVIPVDASLKRMTFYMKPNLPTGLDLPWLAGNLYSVLSQIDLYANEEESWLVLSETKETPKFRIRLSAKAADTIDELIADFDLESEKVYVALTEERLSGIVDRRIELRSPIYLSDETFYMERFLLNPEAIDRDLLLKTFFIDYNLARIIEEKDGGIIYTDGERGLRLTKNSLEYSSPRLEEGQATISYPAALYNSSSTISYHGGWPDGLRLEDLSLSGWGRTISYSAEWQMYYSGYPVISAQPTKARFNDRGLIHYSRSLYFPEALTGNNFDLVEVSDWEDALQVAVGIFQSSYPGTDSALRLEVLSPGYAVIGSLLAVRAEPVWYIKISGEQYILRADNLSLVSREDLQ